MIRVLERWLDRRAGARVTAAEERLAQAEYSLRLAQIRAASAMQRATASGVANTMGRYEIDTAKAWRGHERHKTVEKMLADPHVESTIRFVKLPLQAADWCYEPASDSPRDAEIAEFCNANLLRKGGDKYGREYWCQTSWEAQRLPEILRMAADGFSMFNLTWRPVGGKVVYDRIQWLEPSSVDPHGWKLDDEDNIVEIQRTFRTPNANYKVREPIPVESIALYPWDLVGARFDGRALIRSLFGSWSRKDAFLRAAISLALKVGDPVPIGHYYRSLSDKDKATFVAMVAQLRGQPPDEMYAAFPLGENGEKCEVSYAGVDVDNVDRFRGLIDGENAEMAHGGGTKSLLLGETTSGSRALGDSIGKIEKIAVRAFANVIIEYEMNGAGNVLGVMQALVDRNFANVTSYPRLCCHNLDPDEKTEHIPDLVNAIAAKAVPALPKVQKRILDAFGVEVEEDELEQAAADAQAREDLIAARKTAVQAPPAADPTQDVEDAQDEGDTASMALVDLGAASQRIAPLLVPSMPSGKDGIRGPNQLERFANLSGVLGAFSDGETSVLAELRRVHRDGIADLMARLRAGKITRRNLGGLQRSKMRGATVAQSAIALALTSVAETGARHVAEEIGRQRGGASLAMDDLHVGGGKIGKAAVHHLGEETGAYAELDVGAVWQRLVGEAITEFLRLTAQGLSDAEVDKAMSAFLSSLSEKPLEDMARQTSAVIYNQGRGAALEAAKAVGSASVAVRSEVLDGRTCETCRHLDGKIVEIGSSDYAKYMPPAGCAGQGRCRGFYLVASEDLLRNANVSASQGSPSEAV